MTEILPLHLLLVDVRTYKENILAALAGLPLLAQRTRFRILSQASGMASDTTKNTSGTQDLTDESPHVTSARKSDEDVDLPRGFGRYVAVPFSRVHHNLIIRFFIV